MVEQEFFCIKHCPKQVLEGTLRVGFIIKISKDVLHFFIGRGTRVGPVVKLSNLLFKCLFFVLGQQCGAAEASG